MKKICERLVVILVAVALLATFLPSSSSVAYGQVLSKADCCVDSNDSGCLEVQCQESGQVCSCNMKVNSETHFPTVFSSVSHNPKVDPVPYPPSQWNYSLDAEPG